MDWIFVIVRAISLYTTFYIVSIHLMLLFIGVIFNSCRWCKRFNTSHVTLYLVRDYAPCSDVQSFNTSHVTLYPVPEMIYLPRDSFNTSYVTLYLQNKTHLEHQSFSFNTSHITLLSKKLEAQKKSYSRFNTSHVTLYQVWAILWFLWHFGFQYISCYSLSINSKMTVYLIARFNTSHVTLYLEGEIIEENH